MANEQTKKFGSELREAREKKGLTLKDIYAQIRIDEKYLQALEDGEFSILPEVYIRAFIREYSAEIDLDPDEMIKKYELAKEGVNIKTTEQIHDSENEKKSDTKKEQTTIFDDSEKVQSPNQDKSRNEFYYYIAGGLAILFIIIYLLFGGNNNEEIVIENKYETPTNTAVTSNKTKTTHTNEAKEGTPQQVEMKQVETNPFEITFLATDTVWMRVLIDKNKTEEFTLYPGISRIIKVNSEANALIGNSGGLEIYLEGNKLDFKGKKGKIKNVLITKNGLVYKKISKQSGEQN